MNYGFLGDYFKFGELVLELDFLLAIVLLIPHPNILCTQSNERSGKRIPRDIQMPFMTYSGHVIVAD